MRNDFRECDRKMQDFNPAFNEINSALELLTTELWSSAVMFPHILLKDFMGHKNAKLTYIDNNINSFYDTHSIVFNVVFDEEKTTDNYGRRFFEFHWIYDFTPEQLSEILDNLKNGVEKNREYQKLKMRQRELVFMLHPEFKHEREMTFEERKELWRLNDLVHDQINGFETDEHRLAMRKQMQDKTEEGYAKENEMMAEIFKEINLKR
jgi:hypothetical protein